MDVYYWFIYVSISTSSRSLFKRRVDKSLSTVARNEGITSISSGQVVLI